MGRTSGYGGIGAAYTVGDVGVLCDIFAKQGLIPCAGCNESAYFKIKMVAVAVQVVAEC